MFGGRFRVRLGVRKSGILRPSDSGWVRDSFGVAVGTSRGSGFDTGFD